ncbi:MAG: hypothetical protein IKZ35_01385 [Clostridia bacterium]|nr:hypothetical protein [Clostridia bacterium]
MNNSNTNTCLIVLISIVIGVIGAVLYNMGLLTNILVIIPYFAVIAAVLIAFITILLLIPANNKKALSKCLCAYSGIIIASSILTIAFVLLALTVTLVVTSIVSAVIIGILIALFAIAVLSFVFFIFCLINRKCGFCNQGRCNCCCYPRNQVSSDDSCGFDLD